VELALNCYSYIFGTQHRDLRFSPDRIVLVEIRWDEKADLQQDVLCPTEVKWLAMIRWRQYTTLFHEKGIQNSKTSSFGGRVTTLKTD
jgi:hypothetical protein